MLLQHETFPELRAGFNDEVRSQIKQQLENSLSTK
jgi:hypothetical protein